MSGKRQELKIITHNEFGPIKILNISFIAVYVQMQCLTKHAFPHLSEQPMPFQTLDILSTILVYCMTQHKNETYARLD